MDILEVKEKGMVDAKSVRAQLKRIKFNSNAWGKAEIRELPNILTPDEKIFECVNGVYDGGFALLVSTDMRVLLIDKKPLNFLNVEDLRFDMINEIDYSHRLLGAQITISAGSKTLKFMSYNQTRLRKLIGHVQDRMSEIKKEASEHQENQKRHLEQINQQLQSYLLAQHQQLMQFQQGQPLAEPAAVSPQRPSPELSDYLFAQSLLREFKPEQLQAAQNQPASTPQPEPAGQLASEPAEAASTDDLYTVGYQEIFGKRAANANAPQPSSSSGISSPTTSLQPSQPTSKSLEVNPLRVAYAKLPMMLRNRKFGRPSFHAHTQAVPAVPPAATQA